MSLTSQELEEKCIEVIESDNLEGFKKYVDSCFHVNSVLRSKYKIWEINNLSMLAIACYSGSIKIVEYLLEHNVDVNQLDSLKKRSALHWAVASNNFEIVKMLIDAGAIINVLDRNSITPLILCSNNGDVNILRCLIKNGANVNVTDRMNSSALDYACMRLNIDIIKELIMNGCQCSSSTPFSFYSPLKYLIVNREYKVARMLIESGFDLKNEKWIKESILKGSIGSKEFNQWLNDYMKTPPTLLSISRKYIRNMLSNECMEEKIDSFKIPKFLKDYLMMKN